MFTELADYLIKKGTVTIPYIGHFQLTFRATENDYESLSGPQWTISFKEHNNTTAENNPTELYTTLSLNKWLDQEKFKSELDSFGITLKKKLDQGETVEWPGIGSFKKTDQQIYFTPNNMFANLFTPVKAQKVIRTHARNDISGIQKQVNVSRSGAAQAKKYIQETKRNNRVTWILLAAALLTAGIFFFRNGCNLSSTGNQQKVDAEKPANTYRLK